MEITSTSSSAHVRKITPSRPRRPIVLKSESNFIKSNKTLKLNVREIVPLKQDEIKFKFENSKAKEILKSRSGLVMNSKQCVDEEFEKLKMHDEKLQQRILDLQISKFKEKLGKSFSKDLNYQKKKTLSKKFIQDKIQKKLLKSVSLGKVVKETGNSVGVQTLKETISETELSLPLETRILKETELGTRDTEELKGSDSSVIVKPVIVKAAPVMPVMADLDSLDSESIQETEEEAIHIQHVKIKEFRNLEISQGMLNNIIQGKEDYNCYGNYLKKFGMHRGSIEKFWDFLGLLSNDLLDEILECQLEYLVGLFDQFVDDLIRDELS